VRCVAALRFEARTLDFVKSVVSELAQWVLSACRRSCGRRKCSCRLPRVKTSIGNHSGELHVNSVRHGREGSRYATNDVKKSIVGSASVYCSCNLKWSGVSPKFGFVQREVRKSRTLRSSGYCPRPNQVRWRLFFTVGNFSRLFATSFPGDTCSRSDMAAAGRSPHLRTVTKLGVSRRN
jgi:hypothetical protein